VSTPAKRRKVLVIGAGLGGLCAGIKLKEAGFEDFTILEKAGRLGGTWRDNTYPGCACDTPVALYQFSFAPSSDWSHIFPRGPELLRYAEFLADKFGLRPHLRLGCGATEAAWDEPSACWRVRTGDGQTMEAGAIITALGQLNRPKLPEFAGRESFTGPAFHSARWDHGANLGDRRVGVIGTAASGIQIIPRIAQAASHLTVFQRSANYLLPLLDRPITEEEKLLIKTAPQVGGLTRDLIYQTAENLYWQAFSWTKEGRDAYTRVALNHLASQVADPELRRQLTPDYPIGCKRILFGDDFYPAMTRANVTLVTEPIGRISPAAVETTDGRSHPLDALVYATGFEATGWRWSLDIVGRDGLHLNEAWKKAPEAYFGITTAHFPNFFMVYGPNTNLGHNTITFMIECQTGYIVKALQAMERENLAAIEVRREAQDRFNRELEETLAKRVWADPRCHNWYRRADGRNTQNWGSDTRDYAKAVTEVRLEDYARRCLERPLS